MTESGSDRAKFFTIVADAPCCLPARPPGLQPARRSLTGTYAPQWPHGTLAKTHKREMRARRARWRRRPADIRATRPPLVVLGPDSAAASEDRGGGPRWCHTLPASLDPSTAPSPSAVGPSLPQSRTAVPRSSVRLSESPPSPPPRRTSCQVGARMLPRAAAAHRWIRAARASTCAVQILAAGSERPKQESLAAE